MSSTRSTAESFRNKLQKEVVTGIGINRYTATALVCAAVLVVMIMAIPPACADTDPYEPVLTERKSEESEQYLWEELSRYSPSDAVTAAVMGLFWRESFFMSNSIAGWWLRQEGVNEDFMTQIDKGIEDGSSRENFVYAVRYRFGGYGLAQWSDTGYLYAYYDFVQERGGSIGDAAIQCEFIFESMENNETLWQRITETDNPNITGRLVASLYDGASELGIETIASKSEYFYKKYTE